MAARLLLLGLRAALLHACEDRICFGELALAGPQALIVWRCAVLIQLALLYTVLEEGRALAAHEREGDAVSSESDDGEQASSD